MSISLKVQNANEIAESMVDMLQNEDFSKMYKTADAKKPSPEEIARMKAVVHPKLTQDKKDQAAGYAKSLNVPEPKAPVAPPAENNADVKPSPEEIARMKAVVHPGVTQEKKDQAAGYAKNLNVPEPPVVNNADSVAVAYTIKSLTKLANALDVNGYGGLANIVDNTMKKISSLLYKKAMDGEVADVDSEKKEALDKIKELVDSGDYASALELAGTLGVNVDNFSDLSSTFSSESAPEEFNMDEIKFN